MAAIRNDWIPIIISKGKMTFVFSLFVCLLVGLPNKGNSAIPAIKPKTPTEQECRHHVEKALDQYFDPKESDTTKYTVLSSTMPIKKDTTVDSSIRSPVASRTSVEKDKKSTFTTQKSVYSTHKSGVTVDSSFHSTMTPHPNVQKYIKSGSTSPKSHIEIISKVISEREEKATVDSSVHSTMTPHPNVQKYIKSGTTSPKSHIEIIGKVISEREEKATVDSRVHSTITPHPNVQKYIKSGTTSPKSHIEIISKVISEREEEECDQEHEDDDNRKRESYSSGKKDEKKRSTFGNKDEGIKDIISDKQHAKIDARLAEDNEDEEEEEDVENEDIHQQHQDDHGNDGNTSDNVSRDMYVLGREGVARNVEHRTTNIRKIKPRENATTKVRSSATEEEKKKKIDDKDSKIKSTGKYVESDEESGSEEEESDADEDEMSRTRIAKLYPIRHTVTSSKTQQPQQQTATGYSTKATGGSYTATVRVAQKLPGSNLSTEQPKTPEVSKKTQTLKKTTTEGTNQTHRGIKKIQPTKVTEPEKLYDEDLIENIYEDDYDDDYIPSGTSFRSRDHIDAILSLDDIGTGYDQEEDKLATSIYKEIKKIHANSIKPMEVLYKYTDSTSRLLGDAEIFNKPMILFLGPWNTGKTSIINYLLGIERTPSALKTGTGITDVDFTIITYGDKRQTVSGTELTVDWRYASLQKFGQGFLDHFKAVTMPHTLLKKINIVDTPGILENRKNLDRGYPFNDAFQWFIDRADAIYVVLDPVKVDVGAEMGTIVDQLKGRDVRFILNKADSIRRSDLMRVVGQLFWNLSPLMGSTEAPVIYAVSLSSKPFNPTAPANFLADQENNFLYDLKDTLDKKVENRILYARRHAVRVRNHAKMVDCYLATYYRHKGIFSNKKYVAKMIVDNPMEYHIYEGLGNLSNVSRYDILDTSAYKNFFQLHPLYDFRPLASTCSYFRGCPMDKLDNAISQELPELLTKYKKLKNSSTQVKQNGR